MQHPVKKQMSSYANSVSISSLTAKLHHKSFFSEDLLEGTWVRDSVLSYLSPSTGLLPAGGQGKPSFWDSLPRAEYGLFSPETVYILWEAAIRHAQKVTL